MATFRQATIAGEQMENPVFTGPSDIYSVYWIYCLLCVLDLLDFSAVVRIRNCRTWDIRRAYLIHRDGRRPGSKGSEA
jgi:hypothetical protein